MGAKIGHPKSGGRKKGTPNKITFGLRDFISKLLFKNRKQIELDLQELTPKERILMFDKLLQYVIPKQREFDINAELPNKETEQEKRDKELLNEIPEDALADIALILQDVERKQLQKKNNLNNQ